MSNETRDDSEDFAAMLAEFEAGAPKQRRHEPKVGDKVRGTIVSVGRDNVFVDLGAKAEGSIEIEQLQDDEGNLRVAVGDTIEASVAAKDDRSGVLVLRTKLAGRGPDGLAELEQAQSSGMPIEGLVTGVNKGGVEVQIAGVRCFCPMSQLDLRFVEQPETYVGQRLSFRITRYEGGRHPNVVLSRRALLEAEQAEHAAVTRKNLTVGAVMTGTVTTIKSYGAFVDLGGIEGMVHVSQLSFDRVERPEDVLSVGQRVEVAVLEIKQTGDPKRPEKISLSVRALHDDPWKNLDTRFPVGGRVLGTVSRLQPFGAFVELAPGVEGLVHISELGAGRRVNHPKEVVSEGNRVECTVLSVEPDKRRISLSIGRAVADDAAAAERSDFDAFRSAPSQSLGTFGDLLKGKLSKS